jgi:hypothetical protein
MSIDSPEDIELEEDATIDDFVDTLEELKSFLEDEGRESLLPFIEAYLRITSDVRDLSEQGGFNDPEALEELDLKFGRLYLEPVRKYLEKDEKQEPWKNYLNYIEREDSIPLMELALGINSHINADLATAVRKTGYRQEKDFEKVNQILRKNLGPMLRHLAFRHRDPASIGVLSAPPLAFKGLGRIERWRDLTWRNAYSVDFSVKEVNRKTERNAERMIELVHRRDLAGILKKPKQYVETKVEIAR